MKNLAQVAVGLLISLAAVVLLLGALSLSLAENNAAPTRTATTTPSPVPTQTLPPTFPPTVQAYTATVNSLTPFPTVSFTLTPTLSPTPSPSSTATVPQPTTYCPPPLGWIPYIVQPYDTLDKLASYYQSSSLEIQQENCLAGSNLQAGMLIFVPPITTAPTQVPVACGPPNSWIVYLIQPGDTLYHLSQVYGVTVPALQNANCMGSSTILHVGKYMYVPPWAPLLPPPVYPVVPSPTTFLTDTPQPSAPAYTPTDTLIPATAETPGVAPSETADPNAN